LKIGFFSALGRNPLASMLEAHHGWRRSAELHKSALSLAEASQLLKTEDSLHCWRTPLGTFWTTGKPEAISLALVLAEQQMRVYDQYIAIQQGDIVLDCGANIGAFAVHALEAGAARVVAFEPSANNAECLRRNTDRFPGRTVIVKQGVWDKQEQLPLLLDANNPGGNSFITRNPGSFEGPSIPLTTIDLIVTEQALPRVDFIKIDVEAAETRALMGAEQTIRAHRPRLAIAVEHTADRLANARQVLDIVRQFQSDYTVSFDLFYVSDGNHLLPEVIRFR
jgi:FkbM family methyltransferase